MQRLLLSLALVYGILCAQEIVPQGNIGDFKPHVQRKTPKKDDMTLPVSPLLVNGSKTPEIALGKIFKLSQVVFPIEIENPSDTDVEYENVVINCNCTKIISKIPMPGKIPAHGKLKVLASLNTPLLRVDNDFLRMIRFELKGYRSFQINFSGFASGDLYAYYYDDPERKARTNIAVGYIVDTDAPWNTRIYINTELPEGERLDLGKPIQPKNFAAKIEKIDEQHWVLELFSRNPMKPGVIKEAVLIPITHLGAEKKIYKDFIFMPIEGIIGMQLAASADDIVLDPLVEKEKVVKKKIRLCRANFVDAAMIKATFKKQATPYSFEIKPLTVSELEVSKVDGIQVELTEDKSKTGVYATFTIDQSKMNEEGVYVTFKAPKTKELDVRVAILSEKERAELAEEARIKAEQEEEERKAQQEQEEMQKERKK